MSLSNSVSFLMPPNAKVFVQAMSNAAFMQNVTITPPAGTTAAFAGNGEGNVQMKLVTQGFLTAAPSNGQPSFTTPAAGGTYKVTVTHNPGTSNVPSVTTGGKLTAQNPDNGDFGLFWVISEDAKDKDFNDAVVLFTHYTSAPPI
jgi:hypothetical protein